MLWVKAFHIVSWPAGLCGSFYLPRIFVNLAMVAPDSVAERERLLTDGAQAAAVHHHPAVPALALGLWLWLGYGIGLQGPGNGWMHAKLTIVLLVVVTTTPVACCCASWPTAKASAAMCGFLLVQRSTRGAAADCGGAGGRQTLSDRDGGLRRCTRPRLAFGGYLCRFDRFASLFPFQAGGAQAGALMFPGGPAAPALLDGL